MLDLDPGDDLEALAQSARSFAEAELAPRLRDFEAARAVDEATQKAWAQIGLSALEWPEARGGAGLGALARVLVNEELGAGDPGAALALDLLGPALYPLLELGGESALAQLAPPEGRAVLVSGADAALERRGDRVSGRVPFVPAAAVELLVVLSRGEAWAIRSGIEAVAVPGSGLRAAGSAELRLCDAPLAARWTDAAGVARALGRARLYLGSLLLGVLRQAAEFSRLYALERRAFGRPIAHHQALGFLIVDMRAAIDGARLLLHDAAWRADRGRAFEAAAAGAWAEVVETSTFVGPAAVQILGGHGFMQDYPVEKSMREARALGLLLGGLDAAREDAGRALVAGGAPVALLDGDGA